MQGCKAMNVIIIVQQDVKIVKNEKDYYLSESDSELMRVIDGVLKDFELVIASESMECERISHIEQFLASEVKQLHERSNTLATEPKKHETEIMQLFCVKDHDDMRTKCINIRTRTNIKQII
ncbi:MAG: hypothetical protein EZS28_028567 [Streblomastix strix]|uniref:Uncharacterized protein n=1 Tax=Streblomastix strix TaxID=222440 RepID=A0A5J4V1G0_9EUKA|nr:MAG: hypothetical protein EZS28_028567 [Streblomastix strix]